MSKVYFKLIKQSAKLPQQATSLSAGYDCFAAIDDELVLLPGSRELISLGFCMELPADLEAQIRPRSGLAVKYGVTVLNSPGTIDADYRGEVKVILCNHGDNSFSVLPDMRIAQIIFHRVEHPDMIGTDQLSETIRSSGGFGHSGE